MDGDPRGDLELLTSREMEIIDRIAAGLSNQEIADQLFLTLDTVKWYNSQIFQKLGVRNRTRAVAVAQERGLLIAPSVFPTLQLPLLRQRTPFFGREAELTHLRGLLDNPDCHCISIVGVGGVGKTRLAVRAMDEFTSKKPDTPAHFVNLTAVAASELIPSAIAHAIGITITPFSPPLDQLLQAFQSESRLLVLDNFEQLLPDGVSLVLSIMEHAPQIKFLITSRERLRVTGEWSIRLQGLETPQNEAALIAPGATLTNSVRLFVNAAQRINHQFEPFEIEAIAEICQLVQGIPLAIELAASWTEVQTCGEILADIRRQVLDLVARQRDVPDKHQSLYAVFETTWARLSPEEQYTLKRLAVFRGGFLFDAAASVAGATREILGFLQDKMLIQPHHEGRLVLHEMIQQLALQKLIGDGALVEVQSRHAEYYLQWMETNLPRLKSPEYSVWIARFSADIENLRMVWAAVIDHRRADWFLQCWDFYWTFYCCRDGFFEGERAFNAALEAFAFAPDDDVTRRARGLCRLHYIMLIFLQGRVPEAVAMQFSPELEVLRNSSNPYFLNLLHGSESFLYHAVGNGEAALRCARLALEQLDYGIGDPYMMGATYFQLGRTEHFVGDYANARLHLIEALRICREEVVWRAGLCLTELGYISEVEQDLETALGYYELALSEMMVYQDWWIYERIRIAIGRVQLALGAVDQAVETLMANLNAIARNPVFGLQIDSFVEIALILKVFGEPTLAIALLEYCALHPECYQPTRDRAKQYLLLLRDEMPELRVETARHLLPLDKADVVALLIGRLHIYQSA